MSIIAAGTTTTTALSSTGNTDGTLQLQVNGTTPSVTLNTLGAVGVGSTPNFGTAGQALVSGGSTAAPTWASVTTSPAGSNTQIQYNNSGSFGASSGLTYDGTKLAISSSSAAVLESIKSTSTTSQSALFQVNNDADVPFNIGVFGSTAGTFGVLGASTPFVSTNASTLNFVNTNASGAVVFGIGSSATERFRFGPAGQLGIGGATYGTSGQVLTSGGSGAAPTWSDAPAPAAGKFLASGTVSSASGITLSWASTGVKRIQVLVSNGTNSSNGEVYVQVGWTSSVSSSSAYVLRNTRISGTSISNNAQTAASQWNITRGGVITSGWNAEFDVQLGGDNLPYIISKLQQFASNYDLQFSSGQFTGSWSTAQFQSVRVWWDSGTAGRVTVIGFTE